MKGLRMIAATCSILPACFAFAAADAQVGGGTTPALVAAPGTRLERDVAYGTQSSAQRLDMVYPEKPGTPAPVVFYVHGGGWNGGDKGDDPEMMMGMLNGLAADGFVAASVNYRLDKEAPFPAAVEDCKLVVRWLRAHAEKYGIDAKRIGVVGGSAGGHLAAMLAVTEGHRELEGKGGFSEESSAVQAAASVSGPTDLQVTLCAAKREDRYKMVSDFLGGPLDERKELARRASPIAYVRKDLPPTLFVHCKDDPAIDVDQSIRMAEALKKAGAPTRLMVLDGTNHGSDMARTEPVLTELRKFFRVTLTPAPVR
jgi:acetyl esterase/lipase